MGKAIPPREFHTLYLASKMRLDERIHETLVHYGIKPCQLTSEDFEMMHPKILHDHNVSHRVYETVVAMAFEMGSEALGKKVMSILDTNNASEDLPTTQQIAKALEGYMDECKTTVQRKIPAWDLEFTQSQVQLCSQKIELIVSSCQMPVLEFSLLSNVIMAIMFLHDPNHGGLREEQLLDFAQSCGSFTECNCQSVAVTPPKPHSKFWVAQYKESLEAILDMPCRFRGSKSCSPESLARTNPDGPTHAELNVIPEEQDEAIVDAQYSLAKALYGRRPSPPPPQRRSADYQPSRGFFSFLRCCFYSYLD